MEEKSSFYVVAIVAVVAVIALVVLVMNRQTASSVSTVSGPDTVGQAAWIQPKGCTDSDGGLNYYKQGVITGNLISGDIAVDICVDNTTLRELFCNDHNAGEPRLFDCPNGCVNGACIGNPRYQV